VPREVFLVPDANAFVASVGGFMGFGARRFIGLGLPLMQILSIAQFRAILAHEFAHLYAGDMRVDPWLYSARTAMERVVTNLQKPSGLAELLNRNLVSSIAYRLVVAGFVAYWNCFLRLIRPFSIRKEYRSDELACHVAGSQALIDGLQMITRAEPAIGVYWVFTGAMIKTGYKPNLALNFGQFMQSPEVEATSSNYLDAALKNSKTALFAAHPPLGARIARLRALGIPTPPAEELLSISLINDLDGAETSLIRALYPGLKDVQLKPLPLLEPNNTNPNKIEADPVADPKPVQPEPIPRQNSGGVNTPFCRKQVAEFLHLLTGLTVAKLPEALRDLRPICSRMPQSSPVTPGKDQKTESAIILLFAALTLVLLEHGWEFDQSSQPRLRCGEFTLEPLVVIAKLRIGNLSSLGWSIYCANTGIGGLRLDSSNF